RAAAPESAWDERKITRLPAGCRTAARTEQADDLLNHVEQRLRHACRGRDDLGRRGIRLLTLRERDELFIGGDTAHALTLCVGLLRECLVHRRRRGGIAGRNADPRDEIAVELADRRRLG